MKQNYSLKEFNSTVEMIYLASFLTFTLKRNSLYLVWLGQAQSCGSWALSKYSTHWSFTNVYESSLLTTNPEYHVILNNIVQIISTVIGSVNSEFWTHLALCCTQLSLVNINKPKFVSMNVRALGVIRTSRIERPLLREGNQHHVRWVKGANTEALFCSNYRYWRTINHWKYT